MSTRRLLQDDDIYAPFARSHRSGQRSISRADDDHLRMNFILHLIDKLVVFFSTLQYFESDRGTKDE